MHENTENSSKLSHTYGKCNEKTAIAKSATLSVFVTLVPVLESKKEVIVIFRQF